MRFARVFVTALMVSVLAFASTPAATAPPPQIVDVYELTVGASPLGTEQATRAERVGGLALSGSVTLSLPDGSAGTLKQDATFTAAGTLTSYTLDIAVGAQQMVIKAVATDAGYTLTATPRGATNPARSNDLVVKAPVFVLDNTFSSHLDVLTRSLADLAVGQERSITALVPQAFLAIPTTVRRAADGTGTLAGLPVVTRNYGVTLANVREELVARASDGALLQVAVPIQDLLIRRKGFEPAAAKSAAPESETGLDARESSVSIASAVGPLPATLLVPKSARPVPGIIFLSGSGPNDRDETIGPNKPFRDIARGLGDRGIATLRFDKRTHVVKDPAKFANVQLKDEYYDDAASALAQLRATPGVDATRIFVLGHSEGAMVVPIVAKANPGVRGMILMAPGVRPIDEILLDQVAFGAKLTGTTSEGIATQLKQVKEAFAAIRDPKQTNAPPFMGAPAAYWREVIALDLPGMVRDAKVPVLVVQGDKDIQVRKNLDFDVLKAKAGTSNGRVTYKNFPGLNHLFMAVEGEPTGAEYGIPGSVDPSVVVAIADWVLAR